MIRPRSPRPARKPDGAELELTIEKIVPGGDGLARHAGQVVFVPHTAPGDRIRAQVTATHGSFLRAQCLAILAPGPQTVDPGCERFGQCGGCQLRRLPAHVQNQLKTGFVQEGLVRIAHLDPAAILQPLLAAEQTDGYRRRALFRARMEGQKVALGFLAEGSDTLVDLTTCPVLEPRLNALLAPLRETIAAFTTPEQIQAVEAVAGDHGMGVIFHLLQSPSGHDKDAMRDFAQRTGVHQLWVGDRRPGRFSPLVTDHPLTYAADGFAFGFHPGDFIQVHAGQNRRMIEACMAMAGNGATAWDLYCGIGNFTLPLSRRFRRVTGVESQAGALARARKNLTANRVANVTGLRLDLSDAARLHAIAASREADLVLLDPPRSGAAEVCRQLADAGPRRLLYVSCDPATFARDADILVQGGYRLERVCPIDLFPQTRHVEIMAVLERG
ncbi:MAG: 23S rRNA (uracil(1939)-C(5))-methyltransferase RlmD [Magnetococcales bacterium]|nr:23S rRNA (uracil(1939)-C(5))-methyltransferase RlmD [Magnetococcales bacterium]